MSVLRTSARTAILLVTALFCLSAFAKETHVAIPAGDHEIPAILSVPEGATSAPAVLLIHGFASVKDEVGDFYKRLAAALDEEGIASLRFDFAGSGESTQPFTYNTVDTQIADARRAFDYLSKQDNVDPDHLGVVGFSLGGIVASALAGSDERVKALVLWSTPGDTAASFADLYDANYATALKEGKVEVDLGFRKVELSPAFFKSLFSSFPLYDIRSYSNPLLVIAGAKDTPQPRYAREFVLNAGSTDITLRIIAGANHIYNVLSDNQSQAETVIETTAQWMAQKLP